MSTQTYKIKLPKNEQDFYTCLIYQDSDDSNFGWKARILENKNIKLQANVSTIREAVESIKILLKQAKDFFLATEYQQADEKYFKLADEAQILLDLSDDEIQRATENFKVEQVKKQIDLKIKELITFNESEKAFSPKKKLKTIDLTSPKFNCKLDGIPSSSIHSVAIPQIQIIEHKFRSDELLTLGISYTSEIKKFLERKRFDGNYPLIIELEYLELKFKFQCKLKGIKFPYIGNTPADGSYEPYTQIHVDFNVECVNIE